MFFERKGKQKREGENGGAKTHRNLEGDNPIMPGGVDNILHLLLFIQFGNVRRIAFFGSNPKLSR